MGKVVTMGEALIAFDPAQRGPLGQVESFRRYLGGAEVNVAIGLARLGSRVRWFGRLGDDPFGAWIYRYLRGEGVEVEELIFDPFHPTGIYIKERRSADLINSYYYRSGSAASFLRAQELPGELLAAATWLHLTGITPALSASSRDATLTLARAAQRKGVKVSFDPNLRLKLWSCQEAKATITSLASLANLVLPGLDEGIALWGEDFGWEEGWSAQQAAEALGRFLLSLGAEMVVVKMGADGALLVTEKACIFYPAYTVKQPFDTVGAGDAFAAGLLHGLIAEKKPSEAIRIGQAVAAFVVSAPGDHLGLPTISELEGFLGKAKVTPR
jgi:2-dehydro-3-deoxygluconokinase